MAAAAKESFENLETFLAALRREGELVEVEVEVMLLWWQQGGDGVTRWVTSPAMRVALPP